PPPSLTPHPRGGTNAGAPEKAGGPAHRTAGVRAQSGINKIEGDGNRRAAARTTGYESGIPGVAALTSNRVEAANPERKLHHGSLAENDSTRLAQARYHSRVRWRDTPSKQARSRRRRQPHYIDVVLDCNGHAVQQAKPATVARCGIYLRCPHPRAHRIDGRECTEPRVQSRDA